MLQCTTYCILVKEENGVDEMKCPYCLSSGFKVTDKRTSPNGIRRRRECLSSRCGKRFTTYEKVEPIGLHVVKKDGRREAFDREKLERGLKKAFEKREVAEEELGEMVDSIEKMVMKKGGEIKSSVLGNLVMKKLEKKDKVAYVRFASVYNDFHDVSDFRKEIRGLKN
jgi:transcriptional repressor NrdR